MAAELPPSPIELHGPRARGALSDAAIWLGLGVALFLAWQLADAILLILAGLVFAAALQGGVNLLGRVWRVHKIVRLIVVVLMFLVTLGSFLYFAGTQLIAQFAELQATLLAQSERFTALAREYGISTGRSRTDPVSALKAQVGGSIDRVAWAVGGIAATVGGFLLIVTFGIFVAAEPRLYERGIEWLTPAAKRAETRATLDAMAAMLRRWVTGRLVLMLFEGALIFIGLSLIGAPLALLLGLVTAMLAFIPNIGAIVSGALIVAVGFTASTTIGLWSIAVYLTAQLADNFINPLIEKRAVDLAPAVVLAAQLLFGVLFGVLGLVMADPIVALIKVALTRRRD